MSTIVTRAGKGSALTHNEVDANFVNLNTDKLQSGNTAAALTITSATINGGTITGTALNGTLGATTPSTVAATTISASGVSTFSAGSAGAPAITTAGDTNTGIFFPAADTIAFAEGGVESMRIDSSGNVGIGTASPTEKLQVSGSSADTFAFINTTGTTKSGISLGNGGSTYGQLYFDNANNNVSLLQKYTSGSLILGTNSTERMRLDASGNLGLGVTPSAWNSSLKALQIQTTGIAANNGSFANFSYNTYYDSVGYKYQISAAALMYQQNNSSGHIWYKAPSGTAGNAITFTQAMTLDTSGNLGLGVTPATTWNTNAKVLQINGFNSLLGYSSNITRLTTNSVFSGAGETYGATGAAAYYQQGSGAHSWFTAPSGTAGNAITFTQAMTLDASGNLRVGTTGAIVASSEKLTVAVSGPTNAGVFANGGGATDSTVYIVNQSTSGNNLFTQFATEAGAGTVRGSITYNRAGGLTVYNTTSDYRAKIVKGAVENALGKVALLKPCTGRMNGASEDIDFFVAHELQEVIPSAVTGEKDATKEEEYQVSPAIPAVLDEEGNEVTPAVEAVMGTRTVPVYQMVDKSALIPLLTAAIQEQQAMIDELKAKVAALEAA
jgi:hypothetical protein